MRPSALSRLTRTGALSSSRAGAFPRATLRPTAQSAPARPTSNARLFWSSSSSAAVATAVSLGPHYVPSVDPSLLPILFAVLLSAISHAPANEEDDLDNAHNPPWTVVDFSGKGKGFGVVAARDIERGERLIAERPVCVWPQGLSEQRAGELFEEMDERAKEVFMQLARTEGPDIAKMDEILARRATNGFAIQIPPTPVSGPTTVGMVFPRIARINHSCLPNASQTMNLQTLRMEVYALTSIPQGTELNISYLPLITNTAPERSSALKEHFGFSSCCCKLCTSPSDQLAQSDARRKELRELSEGLRQGRADRKGTVTKMGRIYELIEEEGYTGLPEFKDEGVSSSFAVYATMRARSARGE